MTVPVLLVATATLWYGAARIPRALAQAGFEVALLAPRNSLAEKSRYVTRVGYLPDNADAAQWVYAFAAMVKATMPRIVVPTDDMAFRLLQMLFYAPRNHPVDVPWDEPELFEALLAMRHVQ